MYAVKLAPANSRWSRKVLARFGASNWFKLVMRNANEYKCLHQVIKNIHAENASIVNCESVAQPVPTTGK